MKPLIINRKKSMYYRLLVSAGISSFFIIKYLISVLNSESAPNYLLVVLFGLFLLITVVLFINALAQIFTKAPALLIDEEGIKDHLSLSHPTQIDWDIIVNCDIKKYSGSAHLVVELKDHSLISLEQNRFKRKLLEVKIKDIGTPIAFSKKLVDFNLEELKSIILKKIAD